MPLQTEPLLRIDNISKSLPQRDRSEIVILRNISIEIFSGEFVAIVGPSGSGKTTLLNILGCLDTPTSGRYFLNGVDISKSSGDELSAWRREVFGFVFQSYNLLPSLSVHSNVELPGVYAELPKVDRQRTAKALLNSLGISRHAQKGPASLSGGEQQRVAIARALMNDPDVILADEPTGALDSKSGEALVNLLKELNQQGRTIILVTHDEGIAAQASRRISIKDGTTEEDKAKVVANVPCLKQSALKSTRSALRPSVLDALQTACLALTANSLRSALTLLGTIIGTAAVIAMIAIGDGGKQSLLDRIKGLGPDLIVVLPSSVNSASSNFISPSLTTDNARAIATLENIKAVIPEAMNRVTVQYGKNDHLSLLLATNSQYAVVHNWSLQAGEFFSAGDDRNFEAVVVVGEALAKRLFPNNYRDLVGRTILLNNTPFMVIGILQRKGANAASRDEDDVAIVPLSSGSLRLLGRTNLNSITIQISNLSRATETERNIKSLLTTLHGRDDTVVRNMSSILQTYTASRDSLTRMLGAIAGVSLLVGGIGIMNMLLVSVTERTSEIGIRMAVGARKRAVLTQFLFEAVILAMSGGFIGCIVGILAALILEKSGLPVILSWPPVFLAFSSAFVTGVIFGYVPAHKAANLRPREALAR